MSQVAIKVENISKKYNLLHQQKNENDSLIGAFGGGIKSIFSSQKNKTSNEEFWALQNINFTINKGDRVGIIGRNGAGKSTLLKILSRIVKPTTGKIEYYGRMASLLEVGTGFHGDLSGRENIYLNGSILGMPKTEIDKKFEAIVNFAEVEKFLDTPVKRYSSGMYVRLAFAIAAHLEPEILIVDEVLAVGDSAFQKKCMGIMEESSQKDGRTILFVSHNMGQIAALCTKGILLNKGNIEMEGNVSSIVSKYYKIDNGNDVFVFNYENDLAKEYSITQITLLNAKNEVSKTFAHDESVCLKIIVNKNKHLNDVLISVYFSDMMDKRLFTTQIPISEKFIDKETLTFYVTIPPSILTPNTYNFSVGIHVPNIQLIDEKRRVAELSIYDNGSEFYKYVGIDVGSIFIKAEWDIKIS